MTDKELLLVFEAIRNHTVLLMTNWDQYMVLFADQQCLVEMKNGYPIFGNILHNTLYRDVVLGIARLLDPANQGKDKQHKNASLPFLKNMEIKLKLKFFVKY